MNKIKFIYFDLGGVFFRWRVGMKKLAARFGRTYEEFEQVRLKYDDIVCRGQMTTKELWQKYEEELGLEKIQDFDFAENWAREFEIIPEAHDLALELSKSYSLGVLTNIYPGMYEKQIQHGLVPQIKFDPIIRSCDLGLVKPEEKIYQIATQKAGGLPSEIFYIDDLKINVEAARKLGWQTVWFEEDNPQKSVEEIKRILSV